MNMQVFTQNMRNFFRKKLITKIQKNVNLSDQTVDNNKIMTQIFIIKGF